MRTEGVLPKKIRKIRFIGQSSQDHLDIQLEDSQQGRRSTVHVSRGGSVPDLEAGVRRSPRFQAMNNNIPTNATQWVTKKNAGTKRKLIRDRDLRPPTHPDDDDDDFTETLAQQRRRIASQNASVRAQSYQAGPPEVQQPAPAEHAQGNNEAEVPVKRCPPTRCSPRAFGKFIKLLNAPQKEELGRMGFGGLLSFKPDCLDRELLLWLMEKLNPETMMLEIGGGKVIEVSEFAVWCVFHLPRTGCDLPRVSDKEGNLARQRFADLISAIDSTKGTDSTKIKPSDIRELVATNQCDDAFVIRCFFVVSLNVLLLPNSDSHIRGLEAKLTESIDLIRSINWCKVVVDDLRFSVRLWRKDRHLRDHSNIDRVHMNGCGIFLTMLYIDHLQHQIQFDAFHTPRCAILDSRIIDKVAAFDARGDGDGSTRYGNLNFKSISETCYQRLPYIYAQAPPKQIQPTSLAPLLIFLRTLLKVSRSMCMWRLPAIKPPCTRIRVLKLHLELYVQSC